MERAGVEQAKRGGACSADEEEARKESRDEASTDRLAQGSTAARAQGVARQRGARRREDRMVEGSRTAERTRACCPW